MTKVTEILVHCWNCGEVFYIEIANVTAGRLFCSDKCRDDNLKKEIEAEKKRNEAIPMNTKLVGRAIQADKASIIALYESDTRILDIAKRYGVAESTMYRQLKQWGIPIKRGVYGHRKRIVKKFKLKKNPELIAKMKVNSRVNREHIKQVDFVRTSEDQRLVSNIINHRIIG